MGPSFNVFDECLSVFLSIWKEGPKERTDGSFLPVNAVRAVWRYEMLVAMISLSLISMISLSLISLPILH
jgi:hypothetical protein